MQMHADQIEIDVDLVQRLVDDQLPAWADLQLRNVESEGTTNALYRLGDDIVLRLRLQPGGDPTGEADLCRRFGPVLEPAGVSVPEPLHIGSPTPDYPQPWTAYRWIEGRPAGPHGLDDPYAVARDLGAVVRSLRAVDPGERTWPGSGRGGPLSSVDEWVRYSLGQSAGLIDTAALTTVWEEALTARPALRETWVHNDLMPGNLLLREGRLAAVIDWGQACVADPAVDLQPAWNLLPAHARDTFRANLGIDDEEWARGRGWALAQAIGCLWYYPETNPPMAETARLTLEALLE